MKKLILCTGAALALAAGTNAQAALKFDATSQQIADAYMAAQLNPGAQIAMPVRMPFELKPKARGTVMSSCTIRMAAGYTAADIEATGLEVLVDLDDIVVAAGSVDDIIAVAGSDAVTSVSFEQEVKPMLDKSRVATGMDKVHDGTGLTTGYKGANNVLCGIFDSGIDPNHINFLNADCTENRIESFWRFTSTSGSFTQYTKSNMSTATTDNTNGVHGTHTLGCMAGGHNLKGSSSKYPKGQVVFEDTDPTTGQPYGNLSSMAKNPYYGMAPQAPILACGGALTDTNMLRGIQNMVEYAKTAGKKLVINLSVGLITGPKDGTSNFCAAIEKYKDDAIFFIAAGNDGDNLCTITKKLTSSDPEIKFLVKHNASSSGQIQVYCEDGTPFTVAAQVYDKSTGQVLYSYENNKATSKTLGTSNYSNADHNSNFENAFSQSYVILGGSDNTGSNKRRSYNISYVLSYNTTANADHNKVLAFKIYNAEGKRIDVVHAPVSGDGQLSNNNNPLWDKPTADFTINDMATAKDCIAVGAWNTRNVWYTLSGAQYAYTNIEAHNLVVGHVTGFSSYGMTIDGRSLPHVCAPGLGIISSYNSYYDANHDITDRIAKYTWQGRTYTWELEQGTSMATPIVAGSVATWIEANPELTTTDVRDIIAKTATKDAYVAADNNPVKWGAGKFNAYEGIKEAIKRAAVNDIVTDRADDLLLGQTGNTFDIFLNGAKNINATLYNMAGAAVKNASANGDSVVLDASSLTKGIYILDVNGNTRRVLVK